MAPPSRPGDPSRRADEHSRRAGEHATLVPVGQGEIDYKTIFANADLAGLKHFCIEQDNAADGGDSVTVARTSARNLARML